MRQLLAATLGAVALACAAPSVDQPDVTRTSVPPEQKLTTTDCADLPADTEVRRSSSSTRDACAP